MDFVLALRAEVACLIILIFLMVTSRSYNIDGQNRRFSRIIRVAVIHVMFDFATVITVNCQDTVPVWLNYILHILFYISAILFSNEIANYSVYMCYPTKVRAMYMVGHGLTALYIACLPFLKITYVKAGATYSSSGSAAIVGFALAFVYFTFALVLVLINFKKLPKSFKTALLPMLVILMVTEICQFIWKDILFTGGAITIVTVGFFFSLENPVEVFKKKAMTDALTGVRSRSSYEEDLQEYNQKFCRKPNNNYTFVFCDLNDLRSVNNRFGHSAGDQYISLIASSIIKYMVHSTSVYRIGGDEFLVLYYKTDIQLVEKEIRDLQESCVKASEDLEYTAAVSAGYARSSAQYKSLDDVVKAADYAMYQNKTKLKSENAAKADNINYTGLTNRLFEAMCAASDNYYPFITNLETGVTRISESWKKYFGTDDVFFTDFMSVWVPRIREDCVKGYLDDITSVINGKKQFHYYQYYVKKADGEYVWVTCQGSVYKDTISGITFLSGFVTRNDSECQIPVQTETAKA